MFDQERAGKELKKTEIQTREEAIIKYLKDHLASAQNIWDIPNPIYTVSDLLTIKRIFFTFNGEDLSTVRDGINEDDTQKLCERMTNLINKIQQQKMEYFDTFFIPIIINYLKEVEVSMMENKKLIAVELLKQIGYTEWECDYAKLVMDNMLKERLIDG